MCVSWWSGTFPRVPTSPVTTGMAYGMGIRSIHILVVTSNTTKWIPIAMMCFDFNADVLDYGKCRAPKISDVIVMEIEVKGSTEPYHLRLEPCAIVHPGELFMGTPTRMGLKVGPPTLCLSCGLSGRSWHLVLYPAPFVVISL